MEVCAREIPLLRGQNNKQHSAATLLTGTPSCLLVCGLHHPPAQQPTTHPGVTHIVLDEVHERNLESDLLLMLLRRALLLAQRNNSSSSSGQQPRPPKVLLMSATADAQLFGDYFSKAGPDAVLTHNGSSSKGKSSSSSGQLAVSLLSIPGFTHPVRQLWLEDALQQTGVVIGKTSK